MSDVIRIQMMDTFTIYVNERKADHLFGKSRKGVSLMVMERIKRLFYRKYPNSNIPFTYRIGPLSSGEQTEEELRRRGLQGPVTTL